MCFWFCLHMRLPQAVIPTFRCCNNEAIPQYQFAMRIMPRPDSPVVFNLVSSLCQRYAVLNSASVTLTASLLSMLYQPCGGARS